MVPADDLAVLARCLAEDLEAVYAFRQAHGSDGAEELRLYHLMVSTQAALKLHGLSDEQITRLRRTAQPYLNDEDLPQLLQTLGALAQSTAQLE